MRIVNPLYDTAFKYLMQNEKFARRVLSVILDVEVEEVHLSQQETVFPDQKRHLTLFRLDFKALIKEPDGTKKTILIELQKSKYKTDIQRFRHYLGSAYKDKPRKDIVAEEQEQYVGIYPIVTIYILGYNLDELPYMAVTVNREVIDAATKEKIEVESFFIEHLTHKSHIIQVRRLPEQRRTRLENFMVLFNQAWVTETNSILDLEELPEGFEDLANYLHGPVADAQFLRNLDAEEELDSIFDQQEAKYLHQIAVAQQEKEEAEKREAEAQQREAEAQKREHEAQNREAQALQEKKQAMLKLATKMKKYGESVEDIMRETGLTEQEIENLKI
jgi:predicted transposase/invertase (TIGR01784 family)